MAPKKLKGNPGSSSSSSFDRTRFVNEAARARYDHAKIHRNPIAERGFRRQFEDRHLGPLVELGRPGWGKFGDQPNAVVVSVVREFYANVAEGANETAEVDDSRFEALVADPNYDIVLAALCHPGATWKPLGGSPSCFDEKYLKADIALWYLFVARRMMSVSHKSGVQKERAVLLFALTEGYNIDVGKLINSQIMMSANNSHIGLFFPTIISELCARAGVVFRDDEE